MRTRSLNVEKPAGEAFTCSRFVALLATAALLSSCAAATAIGDLAAKPLEYVGLIESSADEAATTAQTAKNKKEELQRAAIRSVDLSLSAGPNLNADAAGQGLALVVRVYGLRDTVAFLQAPYEAFISPEREAEAFGADVVKSREIVLTPGQKIIAPQEIGAEVNAVGVVALFRNPAANRWRLIFNLKEAARDGIVLGANACALTVVSGLTGLDASGRPWRLLPAQCPK